MYRKYWSIVLLLNLISLETQAQLDPPLPPVFNYLTIDLNTGHPTLFWSPPATDPQKENPFGYIIQKDMFVSGLWTENEPFDTVDANTFTYEDLSANGNLSKISYSIRSKGSNESGPQTDKHSSIFITAQYDSCNAIKAKLDLSWDYYGGWGNNLKNSYIIYLSNSSDPNTFTKQDSINWPNNRFSIPVGENQNYYFYVKANNFAKGFSSYSNLFQYFTKRPVHPTYMSVDSIIAGDKKINIHFKIDPTTELRDFAVVRWDNSDSIRSIFSKNTLHKFSDPTINYFGDTIDNWAARTRPFYYKIDALNSCPKVVKVTKHPNTIIPVVRNKGMKNHIQWDPLYIERLGNLASYRVIRFAYRNSAVLRVTFPETDQLEQYDDVSDLEGDSISVKFCYQIEASERDASNSIVMLSRSRVQCIEIVPGVIMPDAINPIDINKPNNRILAPTITFTANYTLSVYNRWGNLVYNGKNAGWDGKLSNGRYAQEGAYVYRLVVHTSDNQDVVKTGNITVIYQ